MVTFHKEVLDLQLNGSHKFIFSIFSYDFGAYECTDYLFVINRYRYN